MSGAYWDLTAHVRGAISEALVAEAVYQRHTDAILHSPRHPGYDVSSVDGDIRVDAKVASILDVNLDGGSNVAALEWNAGGRFDLLDDSATHLGLVVLDPSATAVKMFDGADVALRGEVVAQGRVFLIPSQVAREKSSPIWSVQNDRPSKGHFRYLRLTSVEQYEAEFSAGIASSGKY